MRPSDELHRLIKSLSTSEKRYFTLHATSRGGPKNYLILFDAIDRMESYDEAALKAKLAHLPLTRQLTVAKRYLYDLIVTILRSYHAGRSDEARVKEYVKSAEILLEKGLADQAAKMIDRGVELARRKGLALPLAAALRWRWRLGGNAFSSEEEIERSFAPLFEALDRVAMELDDDPGDDAMLVTAARGGSNPEDAR